MSIGVQFPKRNGDVIKNSTSVNYKYDNNRKQVTLTITCTIDDATEIDDYPQDEKYGYIKYRNATEIETTTDSANYVSIADGSGNVRLNVELGISGKLGGAGAEEALFAKVREFIKKSFNDR